MSGRVPENAFEIYVSIGPARSYQALAERLGVDKRTIVRHASEEKWAERLAKIQEDARISGDKKITETLQEMQERHLKMLRVMAGKAIQAMRQFPITSAAEGARIGGMVIKLERIVRGEPAERTEISIEEITKRELATLLIRSDEPDGWENLELARGEESGYSPPPVPEAPPPPVEDQDPRAQGDLSDRDIVYDPDSE